jgi:PD-(D/E)XK endonuclease
MEHPKAIGDRTALATMQAFQEAGYALSVPFGENTRYDLIIDNGQRLARGSARLVAFAKARSGLLRAAHYVHHARPLQARREDSSSRRRD